LAKSQAGRVMMIPPELQRQFSSWTPPGFSWDGVELNIGLPMSASMLPVSYRAYLTGLFPRGLVTAGMTIGETIYLNPAYADFTTAAGQALLLHELVHVWQAQTIPNFLEVYSQAALQTPEEQPWLNPFECEAYLLEAEFYCDLVSHGVPSGHWEPLGVQLWGCDVADPDLVLVI